MTWNDKGGERELPLLEPSPDFAHGVLTRVAELEALRAQERAQARWDGMVWMIAMVSGLVAAFVSIGRRVPFVEETLTVVRSALDKTGDTMGWAAARAAERLLDFAAGPVAVEVFRSLPMLSLALVLALGAIALADWITSPRLRARRTR